jgi:hypothetical protein
MKITEICALSREAIETLLAGRRSIAPDDHTIGRRRATRWPFPGTVELWIPESGGGERYALATSLDLSIDGVGIRADEPLTPGMELAVAIHEPEVSFHGRATVAHCTTIEDEFLMGLRFLFDAE